MVTCALGRRFELELDAPVVIGLIALCVLALALESVSELAAFVCSAGGGVPLFSANPLLLARLVLHAVGHSSTAHLLANATLLLLLGPGATRPQQMTLLFALT